MPAKKAKKAIKPGVCFPWEEKVKEYPVILGDPKLVQKSWEELDSLAYLYLWFCIMQS
ncbi:MAG TPA: hypothetical protein VNE39_18260 [Planctomycetota bacterium]|nr:hypothetical protein [Planctomycetota bacterium]